MTEKDRIDKIFRAVRNELATLWLDYMTPNSVATVVKQIIESHLPKQIDREIDENTSDWYHTFKELYEHRIALYIRLVNETKYKYKRHKSIFHNDWSNMDWRFIVMWYVPEQISYHLPLDKRQLVDCPEQKKADKRDWHTADDVVNRLKWLDQLLDSSKDKDGE